MLDQRLNRLMLRISRLERLSAESEESRFFDNPLKRNVREFAESKSISNDVSVAESAYEDIETEESEKEMVSKSIVAPPTPNEIKRKPGGANFSTLNQLVIDTEEDVRVKPVTKAEVPPTSLSEGSKTKLVEKVNERQVTKADKVKAIKEVMKRKAVISPYITERKKNIDREKKEREDKSKSQRSNRLETEREDREREYQRQQQESDRKQKERAEKARSEQERKKNLNQRIEDAKKKRSEEKAKEQAKSQKDLIDQVRNYTSLKGPEKSNLTRRIMKMVGRDADALKYRLRKLSPEDKAKELMRALEKHLKEK